MTISSGLMKRSAESDLASFIHSKVKQLYMQLEGWLAVLLLALCPANLAAWPTHQQQQCSQGLRQSGQHFVQPSR